MSKITQNYLLLYDLYSITLYYDYFSPSISLLELHYEIISYMI